MGGFNRFRINCTTHSLLTLFGGIARYDCRAILFWWAADWNPPFHRGAASQCRDEALFFGVWAADWNPPFHWAGAD